MRIVCVRATILSTSTYVQYTGQIEGIRFNSKFMVLYLTTCYMLLALLRETRNEILVHVLVEGRRGVGRKIGHAA